MTTRTATHPWTGREPEPRDNWRQLALAMTAQAARDLQDSDPVAAVDACLFWLSDGPDFLRALGFRVNPETVFPAVLKGKDGQLLVE